MDEYVRRLVLAIEPWSVSAADRDPCRGLGGASVESIVMRWMCSYAASFPVVSSGRSTRSPFSKVAAGTEVVQLLAADGVASVNAGRSMSSV